MAVKAVVGGPYNIGSTDYFVSFDANGADMVVNLPAATGSGRVLWLKKIDSGLKLVTVTAVGGENIDGINTFELAIQYDAIQIVDAAAGVWWIV